MHRTAQRRLLRGRDAYIAGFRCVRIQQCYLDRKTEIDEYLAEGPREFEANTIPLAEVNPAHWEKLQHRLAHWAVLPKALPYHFCCFHQNGYEHAKPGARHRSGDERGSHAEPRPQGSIHLSLQSSSATNSAMGSP